MPGMSHQYLLSGPIILGFAETALYACVHAFYGADVLVVVVNYNASFLHPAGKDDLKAVARILKKGKTLAYVEARLYSSSKDEPCAIISASYSVR